MSLEECPLNGCLSRIDHFHLKDCAERTIECVGPHDGHTDEPRATACFAPQHSGEPTPYQFRFLEVVIGPGGGVRVFLDGVDRATYTVRWDSSPVPAGHTREVGAEAIHDWPIAREVALAALREHGLERFCLPEVTE